MYHLFYVKLGLYRLSFIIGRIQLILIRFVLLKVHLIVAKSNHWVFFYVIYGFYFITACMLSLLYYDPYSFVLLISLHTLIMFLFIFHMIFQWVYNCLICPLYNIYFLTFRPLNCWGRFLHLLGTTNCSDERSIVAICLHKLKACWCSTWLLSHIHLPSLFPVDRITSLHSSRLALINLCANLRVYTVRVSSNICLFNKAWLRVMLLALTIGFIFDFKLLYTIGHLQLANTNFFFMNLKDSLSYNTFHLL